MNKILRVVSGKGTPAGKTVGVILPQLLHEYLILYALSKGTTKTSVLRDEVLEVWKKEAQQRRPLAQLEETLIGNICQEWVIRKTKKPPIGKDEFATRLVKELQGRGLSATRAKMIVEKFKAKTR